MALIGVLHEGRHPVGDQVSRGLVAGHGQQQDEQVELGLGEPLAVDLGFEEPRDDVVARLLATLAGQVVGGHVELHGRGRGLVARRVVLRVLAADEPVAPVEQAVAVLDRPAQQLGDDLQRQLGRDVGDEVALAVLAHPVDDVVGHVADVVLDAADHPGREAFVHQQPQLGVLRRVHVQHHQLLLGQVLLRHLVEQRGAPVGAEGGGVAVHRDHVLVPRQDP